MLSIVETFRGGVKAPFHVKGLLHRVFTPLRRARAVATGATSPRAGSRAACAPARRGTPRRARPACACGRRGSCGTRCGARTRRPASTPTPSDSSPAAARCARWRRRARPRSRSGCAGASTRRRAAGPGARCWRASAAHGAAYSGSASAAARAAAGSTPMILPSASSAAIASGRSSRLCARRTAATSACASSVVNISGGRSKPADEPVADARLAVDRHALRLQVGDVAIDGAHGDLQLARRARRRSTAAGRAAAGRAGRDDRHGAWAAV